MSDALKAPFPWPGGKSTIAAEVWRRMGADVENAVEPFCGSSAWILGRPGGAHGTETVNDLDGLLINALRAIAYAPDETAAWCDWPVSEACLTSAHLWLKAQRPDLTERLFADPFYYDPMLGGRWLWGIASWIGDGWCVADGPWVNVDGRLVDRRTLPEGEESEGVPRKMPGVSEQHGETGVQKHRTGVRKKMPDVGATGSQAENNKGIQRYRAGVVKQMPALPSNGSSTVHPGIQSYRAGVPRKMPETDHGRGIGQEAYIAPSALLSYFARLSDRLRRVRFLCGDWRRAVKDSITVNHGTTALFLDPPYPEQEHGMAYHGDNDIWHDVARWAVAHGDDARLRIAVCGYFSDDADTLFPPTWTRYRWQARGGYSNQSKEGRGRENAARECVWFSPHCMNGLDALPMFAGLDL